MAGFPRGDQINVLGPMTLLRDKTNSIPKGGSVMQEGIAGEQINELTLDLDDKQLINLAKEWTGRYSYYAGSISKRQETNQKYYLGRQSQAQNALDTAPVPDNILFEASETFYAQALARQPDPVVYTEQEGTDADISQDVRTMLVFLSESIALRQKMKVAVRHWNMYFLGCLKHGWDETLHEITTEVVNPRNLILDPDGYVDAHGDFVGWLGEQVTAPAATLANMYPHHADYIKEVVEYKMGTNVTWTIWWDDDYTFTTFKEKVLEKSRNPHFNYPKDMPDVRGKDIKEVMREGNNHFSRPKKPYSFLSVFNFYEQPHDVTSLIEQNISNQDYITERSRQIKRNAARSNNSMVFNLQAGYTQQTAKQAADGIEDGSPVLEPIKDGVRRLEAPGLPATFFDEQNMRIENLRSIYGTLGNTAIHQDENTTARGMILNQQRSSDRIGGTIGDALNHLASNTYNWWVQLMYVYYDETHSASIMGKMRAVETAKIKASMLVTKMFVGAVPDSTIPKDPITEANQALSLYEAGLPIDPKTVLKLMDTPDIESTIEGGILWQGDKQAYIRSNFPDLAEMLGLNQPSPEAGVPGAPGAPGAQPAQAGAQPEAQPPPVEGQTPPSLAERAANPSIQQVQLPQI